VLQDPVSICLLAFPSSSTAEVGVDFRFEESPPPLPMDAWSAGRPRSAAAFPADEHCRRQSRDRWSCSRAQCARKLVVVDRDDLIARRRLRGVSPVRVAASRTGRRLGDADRLRQGGGLRDRL